MRIYLQSVLLYFLHLGIIHAQDFKIIPYQQSHGLATNATKGVIQDSFGFIWIATDLGVSRFDGNHFINIMQGLPSQYVKSLVKLPGGGILVVTDLGLAEAVSLPDTAWVRPYPANAPEGFSLTYPKDAFIACNGDAWICEDTQLVRLYEGGKKFKRYPIKGSEQGGTLWRSMMLYEENCENLLVVAPDRQIHVYNSAADAFESMEIVGISTQELSALRFQCIAGDKHGRLGIGTTKGALMASIDWKNKKIAIKKQIQTSFPIRHIAWHDGQLYLGSEAEGVLMLDMEQNQPRPLEGLHFNSINYIFEDRDRNIWVCGDVGIALIQPKLFKPIRVPENLGTYYPIADKRGPLYMASSKGELFQLTLRQGNVFWQSLGKHPYFSALSHETTLPTTAQAGMNFPHIAIGNDRSTDIIKLTNIKGEWSGKKWPSNLPIGPMQTFIDAKERIWAVTETGNVMKMDAVTGKTKQYDFDPAKFMLISQTYDGEIYALKRPATSYIFKYNEEKDIFEDISVPISLPDLNGESLLAFDVDKAKDGALWIGTSHGLFKLHQGKVSPIDLGQGYNQYVKSLTIDDQGGFWLSTNMALIYYKDGESRIFTEQSGLPISNIHLDGITIDEHGVLWVSTHNGMAYSSMPTLKALPTPTPIITAVRAENRRLDIQKLPALPYRSYLAISFAAPSYPAHQIKYRYRVKGFINDWQAPQTYGQILLPFLPNGDYTLEIQARQEGIYDWSESTFLTFKTENAWYRTWWGILSMLVMAGPIVFLGARVYAARLRKQKKYLEHLVNLRTSEIAQQKNEIEGQKDLLQLQTHELKQLNEQFNQTNEELQTTIEIINGQKQEIERHNYDITSSIHYASRIQSSTLPSKEKLQRILGEHFVFYSPKDIVSGDFYWCDAVGDKVVLAVADCTGHGVPGALMSMVGDGLLNQIVAKSKILEPAAILRQLDNGVRDILGQDPEGNFASLDGMDVGICTIDKRLGKMWFAGAKTPLIYFLQGKMYQIKGDKYPIGGIKPHHQYQQHEIAIQRGMVCYLYSDGFKDQFGGASGKKFMNKNFLQMLEDMHKNAPSEQKIQCSKVFHDWIDGHEQFFTQLDDVLVMGFKP